ncbi:MAG: PDZ domain-containing protein, partial [Lachnospiraceae bacterium]|nr:PDZ domain-containing protein [Lachnospiraceae bacterium]
YAIPISRAVPIIENLMGQGTKDSDIPEEEQGVLGVSGVSVTADVSAAYGMPVGVYVARTLEGGAAEQAGIKKGDIIVALNGSTIETMDDLKTQLSYYRAGEEVTVTIERPENGGEYEEAEVDLVLSDRSVLQNDQPASGGAGSKAGEAGQAEEGADEENRDKEPSSPFQFNRGE